jgi:hypothetical protein
MNIHKVLLLSIGFLSLGDTSQAGGLLGDLLGAGDARKALDEAHRNLGKAVDKLDAQTGTSLNRQLTVCQTPTGSCTVNSGLKGTTCFCKSGTLTEFGKIY